MAIEKITSDILQHEEINYTIINNAVINNIKNTAALGVYSYLTSKPPKWKINKTELMRHFGCGREHIETCFKYLKEVGALEVSMVRDKKGKCIGWQSLLKRKLPEAQIQNTGNPQSGPPSRIRVSQNLGKPESGFPAPINNINIVNKDLYKGTSAEVQNVDYNLTNPQREEDSANDESGYQGNYEIVNKNSTDVIESKMKSNKSGYFENREAKKGTYQTLVDLKQSNPYEIPEQMLQDWITNRQHKRLAVTKTAWEAICEELGKCQQHNINPIEAFKTFVASGWQHLKFEYFKNTQGVPVCKSSQPKSESLVTREEDEAFREYRHACQHNLHISDTLTTKILALKARLKALNSSYAREMISTIEKVEENRGAKEFKKSIGMQVKRPSLRAAIHA